MNNVWRIFRDDVRSMTRNIVSMLVVLCLCLVPTLYAWFSIAGSWDPYGHAEQLKIAVVNNDEGYESALSSTNVNVGDRIVQELRGNRDYGWVFADEDEAIDGVCSGEYYAALVIPSQFSSNLTAALSGGDKQASIDFCLNAKEDPIASVLAGKDGSEVAEGVRSTIVEVIGSTTLGIASDIASLSEGDQMQDLGAVLTARLDAAADNLLTTATQARALSSLLGSASALASSTSEALSGTESGASSLEASVFSVSDELGSALDSARTAAASLDSALDESGDQSASSLAGDLAALAGSVSSVSQSTASVVSSVQEALSGLSGQDGSLTGEFDGVEDTLNDVANKLESSARAIDRFKSSISMAIENGDLDRISELIGDDPENLAEWMSTPVQIEKRQVYPVENYGSSMAPFFTVISLWMCAVLLVLLMSPHVLEDRVRRYERAGRAVKGYELFLGRYLVFALVALVQSTVTCLGDIFILHVYCAQPVLFVATGWLCAIAFSGIAYMLALSFGRVGVALCVAMLVVPMVGLGDEYPLQMMGGFFQGLYPFVPFAHGIQAMQASIAGVYGAEVAVDAAWLCAFFVAAFAVGLALYRPCAKLRSSYRRRFEDADFA